jgi:hypothetical protein
MLYDFSLLQHVQIYLFIFDMKCMFFFFKSFFSHLTHNNTGIDYFFTKNETSLKLVRRNRSISIWDYCRAHSDPHVHVSRVRLPW